MLVSASTYMYCIEGYLCEFGGLVVKAYSLSVRPQVQVPPTAS